MFLGTFEGGSGIFTIAKLLVQTGDTVGGETLTSISQLAMNNSGTVAFVGGFAGGTGIFTPSALLIKTGDVISGKTLLSISDFPSLRIGINDAGTVIFEATFTPFGDYPYLGKGVFTNSSLALAYDSATGLRDPQISNTGTVIVAGDAGGSLNFIATQSGFIVAEGFDGFVFDYPAINNAGSIAFVCAFGVCTTNSGRWGNGTTISGQTLINFLADSPPALNDAGTLVFAAGFGTDPSLGPEATGIFTASELLVSSDDTIAGKALAFNFPYHPYIAINNSGTIVFNAGFSDGTSGIIMATPISTGVAGDVNGDGIADCADLGIIKVSLSKTYGQVGFDPRADINGDGLIDIRDLAFVAQHLSASTSCP